MMTSFPRAGQARPYFEGWYLKQQNGRETLALIPAYHVDQAGAASASLQVVADSQAYTIPFPGSAFSIDRQQRRLRLGDCLFSPAGCQVAARWEDCCLEGALRFGPLNPPAYDIMGPFCLAPFLECRHSVFSLLHGVEGCLTVNGKQFRFENGPGYWEGDRGVSFPKRYIWTQCSWGHNSIMLSVAEIPFGPFSFVGCVGFIFFNGKERRIATYRGVKLLQLQDDAVLLRQGRLVLQIQMLAAKTQLLPAPEQGRMSRAIRESLSCPVRYACRVGGIPLFDFVSEQASFENNWQVAAV